MTRVEKVKQAQELRGQGLLLREIAVRMGVAISTANQYLDDPDLSKLRARKKSYAKPCDWCGGPTDGSGGRKHQVSVCQSCREWPDDAIIDAIQRWAEEHGGLPPTCADWRAAESDHPCADVVGDRMGWNNALLRAGFGLRCDRRPETQAWVLAQVRAGVPTQEIADALGVTCEAIHERLNRRGLRVSTERAAA